jgi:hypothetical protein
MVVATVTIAVLSVKLIIANSGIKKYRHQLDSKSDLTQANVPTKEANPNNNKIDKHISD